MAQKESCYYLDFGTCTNPLSKFVKKACGGKEACGHFVSETDYFQGTMDGTLKEGKTKEELKAERERVLRTLTQGKTKKQIKREAKLESEKNRITETGGFSLGDDPAFQALFGKKEKK